MSRKNFITVAVIAMGLIITSVPALANGYQYDPRKVTSTHSIGTSYSNQQPTITTVPGTRQDHDLK